MRRNTIKYYYKQFPGKETLISLHLNFRSFGIYSQVTLSYFKT